ncbi:hypothetical protein SATMO3_26730 [Sporomusa aerivorans]
MGCYSYAHDWRLPRTAKRCVKTYTSVLNLYKVCYLRLYKVCLWCGCEFDEHYFHGECPCCGNDDPPPQPGFVLFPELLLASSPLALFPELAFYP